MHVPNSMAALTRFACLVVALLLLSLTLSSSVPLGRKKEGSLESLKQRYNAPGSGLTCTACKVVVNVLQELFAQDASEEEIEKIVVRVCIDLKIEDENVCTLIVPTFQVINVRKSLQLSQIDALEFTLCHFYTNEA